MCAVQGRHAGPGCKRAGDGAHQNSNVRSSVNEPRRGLREAEDVLRRAKLRHPPRRRLRRQRRPAPVDRTECGRAGRPPLADTEERARIHPAGSGTLGPAVVRVPLDEDCSANQRAFAQDFGILRGWARGAGLSARFACEWCRGGGTALGLMPSSMCCRGRSGAARPNRRRARYQATDTARRSWQTGAPGEGCRPVSLVRQTSVASVGRVCERPRPGHALHSI